MFTHLGVNFGFAFQNCNLYRYPLTACSTKWLYVQFSPVRSVRVCPVPGPSVALPKTPMGVVGNIHLGITEMTQNVIILAHPSAVLQGRVRSSVFRAKQRWTDSNVTRACSVQNVILECSLGGPSSKTLIAVCVCVCVCVSVRRHIAKLHQEWFNGLSWNFVGMLGVTMPRMYQILVTNQLNLTN